MQTRIIKKIKHGKDLVIVGDGPIALIAAIEFKQKGVKNISVVGPRLDRFVRSGDVVDFVFTDVSEAIAPLSVVPSESRHIKDVERQLYSHARALSISLIAKRFEGFGQRRHLILKDADDRISLLRGDIVFDCTGTKREVVNKFNLAAAPANQFNIESVGPAVHRSYVLIRAITFQGQLNDMREMQNGTRLPHPVCYALAMEALRELGWKDHALPDCYANTFPKKNSSLRKANIYLQVPDDLKVEDAVKFAKIILKLSQNDPDVRAEPLLTLHQVSKKHPNKPVVSKFSVDPHRVSPGFYEGDAQLPMLFHAGDASGDIPFVMGTGLRLGIKRLNYVIAALTVNAGTIVEMDSDYFEIAFEGGVKKHAAYIKSLASSEENGKRKYGFCDLDTVFETYSRAHAICANQADKRIIKKGLDRVTKQFALLNYSEAKRLFRDVADDVTGLSYKGNYAKGIERSLECFAQACRLSDVLSAVQKQEMSIELQAMAAACKKLADYFFSQPRPRYISAGKNYNLALKIYMEFFPGRFADERLALQLGLINVALKSRDYSKVLTIAERVELTLLPWLQDTRENKITLDKINFHAAFANLELADAISKQGDNDLDEIYSLTGRAVELISALPDNEFSRAVGLKHNTLLDRLEQESSAKRRKTM